MHATENSKIATRGKPQEDGPKIREREQRGRTYPAGNILSHVRANQTDDLGAVFSIIEITSCMRNKSIAADRNNTVHVWIVDFPRNQLGPVNLVRLGE